MQNDCKEQILTMGSLFDGIGGFPLASVRNGITPVWASEIETFPIQVTKQWFPHMIHLGDITKLNGADIPPVSVVCGGSPCQDVSIAGKRQGLCGERSSLFLEQIRIVKEMRKADGKRGIPDHFVRPRYLVWENVPGAFSSSKGEDFRTIIEEIIRIKDGSCHVPQPESGRFESAGAVLLGDQFSLAWRVLDAQYWGVAQRRRRIFLVADFGGCSAAKILFEQENMFGSITQVRRKKLEITCSTGVCAEKSDCEDGGERTNPLIEFSANSTKADHIFIDSRRTNVEGNADTDTSGSGSKQKDMALLQEAFCIAANTLDRTPQNGGNGLGYQQGISYTLTTSDIHAVWVPYQEVVGTLCCGDEKGVGNQYVSANKLILDHQGFVRRLTPLEYERLQGFPDGWTLLQNQKVSDSVRYKALGNSVAIPCVEFVMSGVAYFLNEMAENVY